MSKSKQATLLQSWGNKADKKSNSSQNIDDASRKQPCNSGTGQVIDLCDEVEDEDLLLAMEESLKDAGVPQQRAGQSAPHVDSSSRTDNQYIAEGSTAQSKFQRNGTNQIVQTSKGTKQQTLFSAFGISGRGKDSSTEQSAAICSGVPPGGVDDFNETIIEGDRVEEEDLPDVSQVPDMPGFDKVAGRMWIYPTNYPVRQYQFSIVREALYKNTLVVLPTGLGKTFIAAVVMYNFYRWYPQGKVVFMAPTKPLVAQQIEACYNIMGIPQTDTAEMTGAMQPPERKKSWLARRVFFLTPQVMMNDLSRGAFPASNIKCLVVDEAHKATGNHAYCQVVRELINQTDTFRVLALSATPGSDIKAVQQVMNNLLVSHIELKSEESADIQPYTHARKVDKIVVPLGEELTAVREQYLRILEVLVRKLRRAGVLYNREAKSLSKFLILKAREQFRQNPPENLQRTQFGAVEGDFALAMSLYHGYELLQQHGLRSLFNFLDALWSGDKGFGRTRAELQRNGEFCNLMDNLRSKFDPIKAALPFTQESPRASQLAKPLATGHPKMKKLEEVVLEHFLKFQEQEGSVSGSVNTRIMIFSQYRDSVSEITEVLNRHRPLVKVMSFIGQSSAGKSTRGFTQKEQLKVMRQFREGGYNTLVSTCVGEEGLDIGDVDLIICFDAHKSPIRLVQRMGRTGRKREGRIVMLVTQGKEEQIYNQSQYSKRSIHKAIQNGTKSLVYYQRNQRMVPQGLQPVCHKMHITVNVQYQAATRGRLKPTNTVSTTSGQTSNMGRKKSGVVKKDGFLTEEELAYWAEHYEVKGDVPTLPSCAWVTIKENTPIMTPGKRKQRAEMSLTDWTPWQNRLQDTHTVDHSMQSRHLVELMEFMSVQEAIGEEDNYGMEMQLYLNREDVFRASQRNPPGILRFCTPGGTTSKIDSGAKRKTGEKNKGEEVRKRKRRSEQLPGISSDEEGGGTESEEDLPEFGGMMRDKQRNEDEKRKTRKRRRPCEDVLSDMGDGVSGPSTVILEGEEEEKETQSVIETVLETRLKSKTGKKKKKLQNHDDIETIIEKDKTTKDLRAKMRKDSKNDSTKSGKRRKRKRTSMGEKSVIVVIADIDEDDFEDVQPSHTETEDIVSTCGAALCGENGDDPDEGVTVEHLDVERGEDTTMENCDDLVEGVDLNREKDIKCDINILVKAGDNRDKEESSSEEDTEICDLLPLFTSQKLFKFSQKRTVGKEENVRSVCAVRTPPSVEELREAMQQLDQKGRISPLDILSLVDKWEEEKRAADQEIIPDRSVPTEPIHRCNGQKVKVSVPKMDIKVPGLSGVRRQDKVSELYALADINHSVDLGNMSPIEPDTCPEFEPFENYKSDKQQSSKDINGNAKAVSQEVTITEDKSDSQSRSEKSLKVVVSDPKNCEREEDNLSEASSVLSDVSTGSVVFEGPRASQIPRSQADKDILFSPTLAQPRSLIPSNTSTPLIAPSSQRLSQREAHHSFFSKECDDSLLGLVSTPRSGANHGRISPCHTASVSCHIPTSTKPDAKPNTSQIGIAKTNTSHLRSSQQHVSMAASPKFASTQRGLSSVTSQGSGRQGCVAAGDSMDVSVLTFTQCLAAVHTSMDANSSQDISHTSHTTKTSPSMDASQDISHTSSHTTTTSPNMERKPLAQSENINVNQGVKNRSGEENTNRRQETLLNQNSHQVEEPQFDLGFDFDDFDDDDDDMVIPPSPEAQNTQPFSQRSLSARRNLSLNKSFGQNVPSSQGDKMNKKTPKIVSTEVSYNLLELDFDEPFECEMETEDDLETVRSPSLLDSNTKETPIARPNTGDPKPGAVWGVGSRDPNAGTLKTGVSTNKSPLMKKPLQHENSLDDKKALSDSVTGDDFFKLSDKSIYHAENVINEAEFLENVLAPRRSQSPPVAVVTPVISNIIDKKPGCSQKNIFDLGDSLDIDAIDWGETLEEGKPKDKKSAEDRTSSAELEQIENDIVDGEYEDEDLDESVINMPRRKKKRAVLLSPCSQEVATHVLPDTTSPDFKTPCRPAPRSNKHHKRKAVLISDDEDEDSPVVHRNASRQKPLRDMKFSSDEDDDDFEDTRRAGVFTSRSKYDHHPKQKDISNKRKNNGVRCGFLEVEAELSGDEESEDDEDGSDLDQYDASFIQDATQASQLPDESVDMQAVYMQAVRSPVGGSGRFKLQYNYDPNIDVYSQRPPEEHSEYMQDSFCVGDDYSEYFEDEDDSFVVRDDEISYVRTDKNRRGKNKGKKSGKSGGKPVKGKKRIVRMCESSSEEDEKKVIDIVEEKAWKQSHRKPSKKLSSDSASSDHEKIGANREHSDTGWLRSSNKKSSEKSAPISSSGTSGSLVVPGTSQTASLTMRCQNKLASKTGKTHKLSSVSKSDNSNSSQVTSSITSESHKEKYLKVSQKASFNTRDSQNYSPTGLTQMPSLASRCRTNINQGQKQNHMETSENNDLFSLGVNDFLSDEEVFEDQILSHTQKNQSISKDFTLCDNNFTNIVPTPGNLTGKISANLSRKSDNVCNKIDRSIYGNTSLAGAPMNAANQKAERLRLARAPMNAANQKAERLRLAKLKQEECRRKLQAQAVTSSNMSASTSSLSISRLPNTRSSTNETPSCKLLPKPGPSTVSPPTLGLSSSTITKYSPAQKCGVKRVVFADSREINSAQDIVSLLRSRHGFQVEVRQLSSCDYVVSNRMAIERKSVSDFMNGANRMKLLDRLRHMCEQYERPCLIVEKDRVKLGEEKSVKPILRTKYIDTVVCSLAHTAIKVFYTNSQEETANVMAELVKLEERKGMCVGVPVNISPQQEQVLKLYTSLPRVSYVTALNLLHGFRTIKDFMQTSPNLMAKRGHMSDSRAQEVYNYIRHHFDPQMMAIRKK